MTYKLLKFIKIYQFQNTFNYHFNREFFKFTLIEDFNNINFQTNKLSMSQTEQEKNYIFLQEENQQLRELLQQKENQVQDLLDMILEYKNRLQLVQSYEHKIEQLNKKLEQIEYQQKEKQSNIQKKLEQLQKHKVILNYSQIDKIKKIQIDGWCQTELHICKQILALSQQEETIKKKQKVFNSKSKQKQSSVYSIYPKIPTLTNQTQFRPSQDKQYQNNQNFRYSYQETIERREEYLNSEHEQNLPTFFNTNSKMNSTMSKSTFKKCSVLNKSVTSSLKKQNIRNQSAFCDKSFVSGNQNNISFLMQSTEDQQSLKKFKRLKDFLQEKSSFKQKKPLKNQNSDIQASMLLHQQKSLASTGFSRQKVSTSKFLKMANLSMADKFQCEKAKQEKIKNSPSLQNLMRIKKCYQMLKN